MRITAEANGSLKIYLPCIKVMLMDESCTIRKFQQIVGIPAELAPGYLVNGRIVKGEYELKDEDHVTFIMIVGAG